jgi:hypothetical protein
MVLIIGACLIVLGIIGGLTALFRMDTGPDWLTSIAMGMAYLLIPGIVVFLIGLGMWLSHPHTMHF